MAAILGGAMRVPMTAVVFALELTHDVGVMMPMLIAGHKQVLRSVACSLIAGIIFLILMSPGKFMINKPANTIHDKTNGLDFMVIINSILGNLFTGSFISIILAASLTDQKKKSKASS